MCSMPVSPSAWHTTFPHLITPLPNEWLPGFLMRCDEANGWFSGSSESFVSIPQKKKSYPLPHTYVLAKHLELEMLTSLLDVPLSALIDTTFRPAFLGLFGTQDSVEYGLGAVSRLVQICPACVSEQRFLHVATALRHITHCPIHQFKLQVQCSCGAPLHLCHQGTKPFTCFACGLDWAALSCVPIDGDELALETDYLSLYGFFLTERTQVAYRRAVALVQEELYSWADDGFPFDGSEKPRYIGDYPLDALVKDLVRLGFSVADVSLNARSCPRKERSCLNQACPQFAVDDGANIALYGYYQVPLGDRVPIWCCTVCGSCWFNHRLCLTFDQNCASDNPDIFYPSEHSIQKAQERLNELKEELERNCCFMIQRRQTITLSEAFEKAHFVFKPNLLAPKLGLAQIVDELAHIQQDESAYIESEERIYNYGIRIDVEEVYVDGKIDHLLIW